jgi:hypothetical protein
MSTQLWSVQAQRPARWVPLNLTGAYHVRNDFRNGALRPGASVTFLDQPLTTNAWGMRDRDRATAKPEGTYRIALLGPSHVMGSGVADGETFAAFLEALLNADLASWGGAEQPVHRYEVLNFGVAGYSLLDQLALLEEGALAFQPDAVFITDSPGLRLSVVDHLLGALSRRVDIPYPELEELIRPTGVLALSEEGIPVPFDFLRALLEGAGVETRMPGREAALRLRPEGSAIVRWTLAKIADVVRAHGAVPVFVALDNVREAPFGPVRALPLEGAADAGFLVFDLFDLWQDRDRAALQIAPWDEHPNAAGHRLIAERLLELMGQHASELGLGREVALGSR